MLSVSFLCFLCLTIGTKAWPSGMTIWEQVQASQATSITYNDTVETFAKKLVWKEAFVTTSKHSNCPSAPYFEQEVVIYNITGFRNDGANDAANDAAEKQAVEVVKKIIQSDPLPNTPNMKIGLEIRTTFKQVYLMIVITDPSDIVHFQTDHRRYLRKPLANMWNTYKPSEFKEVTYTSANAEEARKLIMDTVSNQSRTTVGQVDETDNYYGLIVTNVKGFDLSNDNYEDTVRAAISTITAKLLPNIENIVNSKGAITIATSADERIDVYCGENPYIMIGFIIRPQMST